MFQVNKQSSSCLLCDVWRVGGGPSAGFFTTDFLPLHKQTAVVVTIEPDWMEVAASTSVILGR